MESFGRSLSKKPSWDYWTKGGFLGEGTFGTVYEGVSSDGRFFAVKEVSLSDQGKTGKQAIRQLEQEIALLSEMEHPNIVQYLGTERDDEKFYIFLELVSKGSLAHVYEKYFVRYDQVRAYTKQILSGLKYLHDRKIIHRDIKCANILVDTSGVVKLADFGMAKQVDNLGRLKSVVGSAHWMAPEVINSQMGYGLRADIWSLGCTVLEMAIGKPPFGELEGPTVYYKVGHGEGPPIPDDLEDDLQSFINDCLVVNAAERPTCDLLMTHPFITGAPMNGPTQPFITGAPMNGPTQPFITGASIGAWFFGPGYSLITGFPIIGPVLHKTVDDYATVCETVIHSCGINLGAVRHDIDEHIDELNRIFRVRYPGLVTIMHGSRLVSRENNVR